MGHLWIAESKCLVFPKSTQTLVFFNFSVTGSWSAPLTKDLTFQNLYASNQGNKIENPFFKRQLSDLRARTWKRLE